jgi:pimeloyl-ACP methyl ester carboxylesterase
MSSSSQPTVLLVQGSFQLPAVYAKLVAALETRGHPVVSPKLPSLADGSSNADFVSKTLADDAVAVAAELNRLIETEQKDVVVLMHSYGGLVGSEAIPETLTRTSRKSRGLTGGVLRLVFVAAFMLAEGQSVLGAFGESPNNDLGPDGRFSLKDGAKLLYQDLPDAEAQDWEAKLVSQSYAVQKTELTRAAWRYVSSTYVITENDQVFPPQFQEMMAKNANSEVLKINSGHTPMLSKTEELVDLIEKAIEKASAESS